MLMIWLSERKKLPLIAFNWMKRIRSLVVVSHAKQSYTNEWANAHKYVHTHIHRWMEFQRTKIKSRGVKLRTRVLRNVAQIHPTGEYITTEVFMASFENWWRNRIFVPIRCVCSHCVWLRHQPSHYIRKASRIYLPRVHIILLPLTQHTTNAYVQQKALGCVGVCAWMCVSAECLTLFSHSNVVCIQNELGQHTQFGLVVIHFGF